MVLRQASRSQWGSALGSLGRGRLELGVTARLANEQDRRPKPEAGDGDAQEERRRAETGRFGDQPGQEGDDGHGEVARCLVQPEGQAPVPWPDEVDLHQHRRRPGQALVDPEQDVGGHDPAPVGRMDQQERDGQTDEPPGDQDRLPSEAIRHRAGDEIGDGLGQAERDEEREGGGRRRQAEGRDSEQRHDRPLLPDHPADERADPDEQGELAGILTQAER